MIVFTIYEAGIFTCEYGVLAEAQQRILGLRVLAEAHQRILGLTV